MTALGRVRLVPSETAPGRVGQRITDKIHKCAEIKHDRFIRTVMLYSCDTVWGAT